MTTSPSSVPNPPKKKMALGCSPIPWILIILGVIVFAAGAHDFLRSRASADWPTAPGEIRHASVDKHKDSSDHITHSANIKYEYKVEGTVYHGDRVSFDNSKSSDSSHANEIVRKYPKGEKVDVYYMPDDPEVCVLEPGLTESYWFMPVVGLAFFVIGLPGVLSFRRSSRQPPKPNRPDGEKEDDSLPSEETPSTIKGNHTMVYCPKCKAEMDLMETVCPRCGYHFPPAKEPMEPKQGIAHGEAADFILILGSITSVIGAFFSFICICISISRSDIFGIFLCLACFIISLALMITFKRVLSIK